jgi:hypothetical protein
VVVACGTGSWSLCSGYIGRRYSGVLKVEQSCRHSRRLWPSNRESGSSSPHLFASHLTSTMSSVLPTPTPEALAEMLLCARYGDPSDLSDLSDFVETYGPSWLAEAVDERGNTALHMAAGNGHTGEFSESLGAAQGGGGAGAGMVFFLSSMDRAGITQEGARRVLKGV